MPGLEQDNREVCYEMEEEGTWRSFVHPYSIRSTGCSA